MRFNTNTHSLFDLLSDLLDRLSDEQYQQPLDIMFGASIGKHYRHIIEFFQSVALAEQTETICYDNRLRDVRIETSREVAKALLSGLREELKEIDQESMITLIADLGTEQNLSNVNMKSSLMREFHYAVEHAIHHMAIIKMGLKQSFPGIEVPAEFGVAPSTLRFQHSVAK